MFAYKEILTLDDPRTLTLAHERAPAAGGVASSGIEKGFLFLRQADGQRHEILFIYDSVTILVRYN